MKVGDYVKTIYGIGIIKKREGTDGILSERFCIKLKNIPKNFKHLHRRYGGLYFHKKEISKL